MNPLLITIIIYVAVILVVWWFVKKIITAFFVAGILLVLAVLALGYMTYQDVRDLRENMPTQNKLVILMDQGRVLSGFTVTPAEALPLTSGELHAFEALWSQDRKEEAQGEVYKLIIYEKAMFEGMDDLKIIVAGQSFEKQHILQLLSDDAILNATSQELFFEKPHELRAYVFNELIRIYVVGSGDPTLFASQFRKGMITIYPETIIFKIMKYVPLNINPFSA
ncbi:hypothetical protein J4417_05800 [Candidatus Woesearchaeota archaeon]|nr:hypothetical protein [Candidatus Woesearchaeota archaeon]